MKRIIALTVVIVVLIVGYTGAWFWGAGLITGYVKDLASEDGVTEPKVTCGNVYVGGFPFGYDVVCDKLASTLGDFTVSAGGLQASMQVYDWSHAIVFAKSPVSVADAFTGSQSRVDFDSLQASARLTGWRIGRVSLVVEKPVWNDTVLEDRLIAKADHLEAHLVDLANKYDAKAHLATVGQYAEIDNLNAPGFQINAGKTVFQGEATNLPDDVRTYDATLPKRWQQAGGQFQLVDFTGTDGDTHFDVTGNLNLDDQGRVGGQLKLNSKGVVERLRDMIPPQMQGLVLGAQAADGSYSQTLNIAAGVVFAGVVPTGVIPPLY